MSPISFDNGSADHNADYCVSTVGEKLLRLQIWCPSVKGRCLGNQFWDISKASRRELPTRDSSGPDKGRMPVARLGTR